MRIDHDAMFRVQLEQLAFDRLTHVREQKDPKVLLQLNRLPVLRRGLDALAVLEKTGYLKHIRLDNPLTLKIDGKSSRAVLLKVSADQTK